MPSSKIKVEDIMIESVYRITTEMTLLEVCELLIRHEISGAPVVDNNDRVLTVLGEGATLRLAATEGLRATVAHCLPKLTPINKIVTVGRQTSFADAYQLFLKHTIHRIPVVDSGGHLHGLVSRSLIMQLFIEAHYGRKIQRPKH